MLKSICFANDTATVDYAGQLQFIKNEDISIQKETLEFISEKNSWETFVRVTYIMKNESDQDKEIEIAFPLPLNGVAYCINQFTCGPSCDTPEMKLLVDDKPVPGSWNVRLETADKKVSSKIKISDLPGLDNDNYCDDPETTQKGESNSPRSPCSEVQRKNCELLKKETKQKKCEDAIDMLNLNRAYKWKYKFPKKKEIKVTHEYRPGRGGYPHSLSGLPDLSDFKEDIYGIKEKDDKLCIKEMWPTWENKVTSYTGNWTTYTLRTGANWRGPIRHFEFIIQKNEDEIVSTCFPGLKKISSTQFKVTLKNFTPTADIAVGYLKKMKVPEQ